MSAKRTRKVSVNDLFNSEQWKHLLKFAKKHGYKYSDKVMKNGLTKK